MDVWNRQFQRLEGGRDQPSQAARFGADDAATHHAQRCEPRSAHGGGSHAGYAVIWLLRVPTHRPSPGLDASSAFVSKKLRSNCL